MDEALYLEDRGYAVFATPADAAQQAHERALLKRLDRARTIYTREILHHASMKHWPALDACADLIIETIAGCLPLEEGTTI